MSELRSIVSEGAPREKELSSEHGREKTKFN